MDPQAFELLIKNIDDMRSDLRGDISDMRMELHEVKKDVKAINQFKWKLSGVALVFTIMFQGLLAWIQRESGK